MKVKLKSDIKTHKFEDLKSGEVFEVMNDGYRGSIHVFMKIVRGYDLLSDWGGDEFNAYDLVTQSLTKINQSADVRIIEGSFIEDGADGC